MKYHASADLNKFQEKGEMEFVIGPPEIIGFFFLLFRLQKKYGCVKVELSLHTKAIFSNTRKR